jgi:hypothetical protein
MPLRVFESCRRRHLLVVVLSLALALSPASSSLLPAGSEVGDACLRAGDVWKLRYDIEAIRDVLRVLARHGDQPTHRKDAYIRWRWAPSRAIGDHKMTLNLLE